MPLISSAFKPYVEKWLAGIQEITDPMKGLGTVRADSKLVGDQLQEAKMRDYTLVCDEPSSLGGTDKGPNPLEFFMSAVGFCENVHTREVRGPTRTRVRLSRDERQGTLGQERSRRVGGH